MRCTTWILIVALALVPASAAMGQTGNRQEVELSLEDDTNIFERLQIDLMDLQKLSEEVNARLVGEPMRVTLMECVHMALDANQDILIAGFDPDISESDIQAARGEFDPTLSLGFNHRDSISPPSTTTTLFSGLAFDIEQDLSTYNLTLGGKTNYGTQYDLTYSGDRDTGTFTTDRMTGERLKVWSGDLTVTVTQPVLRGFGKDVNRARLWTAKNSLDISISQLELAVMTSVGETIKAYWDLVGAIEQLKVREEALSNAMRLVEINEQRFNIGTAAAIEVLQAKAGAASRQSDLITARTRILDAEDVLKNLIGLYDGDLISSHSIVPVERPNPHSVEWDLEASQRAAARNRPEVRSAQLQLENARLEVESSRDGLLPQFDVRASWGHNSRHDLFGESLRGIADQDGRAWTVGVNGSVPLGNRSARGGYRRSKLLLKQQEQRLRQVQQQVMLNARIAVRGLATNETLIESSKQTRILQEANVAAEEKRLRLGVTTAQDVLDIQEDLTGAQTQEVQSMIDYEKSFVDLQVTEGTLLKNMGLEYSYDDEDKPLDFWRSLGHINTGR